MKREFTKKQIIESSKKKLNHNKAMELARGYKKEKDEYRTFKTDYSDISSQVFEFLDLVQKSGIVNMFMAADLLWSGRQFIQNYAYVHAPHLSDDGYMDDEYDEDVDDMKSNFEELLDSADGMRNLLISKAVEMCDGEIDTKKVERNMKKISKDLHIKWMKYYGTKKGRVKKDVEEGGRTLAKARKKRLYPDVAKKNNPQRFRPADRLDESTKCPNCGHKWTINESSKDPHLCRMCSYDKTTKQFHVEKLIKN